MPRVNMETKVAASPDAVWNTIGGFDALPSWHPAIVKSRTTGDAEGVVRTLTLAGGGTVTERLKSSDPKRRSYAYSLLSSPLPLVNYEARIQVVDSGDGTSTITWSSEFDAQGAPDETAIDIVRSIYQTGFDSLTKMFGA